MCAPCTYERNQSERVQNNDFKNIQLGLGPHTFVLESFPGEVLVRFLVNEFVFHFLYRTLSGHARHQFTCK